MAYIKGIIPKSKVSDFSDHLNLGGYSVRPASSKWELCHVLLNGRWSAITVDAKGVVGLPEDLAPLAQDFLRGTFTPPDINDTMRLDWLLGGPPRNVIKEIEGYNGLGRTMYAIYIEEGVMGDFTYPKMRFEETDRIRWNEGEGLEIQRQAIDLAINNPKPVSEKV